MFMFSSVRLIGSYAWKALKVKKKNVKKKCRQSLLKFCDSVTSHHVTMSNICILYRYIHCRNYAELKLKLWQSQPKIYWAVPSQGCVSWPIRGDRGFRRGALSRWEPKYRQYSDAALDSMRKLTCFLIIKACKPILVVTQIKIINQMKWNEHNN